MRGRIDPVLLVLLGLLFASVTAFLLGRIPYPFGLLWLAIFVAGRIAWLKGRGE
jgi:hypothetical protein